MPDEVSRRLFESLRLELLYDHDHDQVRCRVTLHGDTIATVQQTARNAVLPFRRPDLWVPKTCATWADAL